MELAGGRLLAVIPHPDDEAYSMAGTLALCAASGAQIKMICGTRGESGSDLRGVATNPDHLAQIRSVELARSCAALGVDGLRFLNWPDGHVAEVEPDEAVRELAGTLTAFEPHVIITLGTDGAYGHVDHLAMTRWVTLAMASCPGKSPRRLLHCAFPKGFFEPIWRAIRRIRDGQLVGDIPAQALGCEREDVDLIMDLSAAKLAKLTALSAHASQLKDNDPHSFLRDGFVTPLLAEEWFRLAAGPELPEDAPHPFVDLIV